MNVIDVRGVEWLMNAEYEKGMAADYDRRGQCQNRKSKIENLQNHKTILENQNSHISHSQACISPAYTS
jgi:hypothetical protein